MNYSLRNKKIWVAGHRGMVGSAVMRRLSQEDCTLLTASIDLRRQADVEQWMRDNRPDAIILAAAKVGGITANRDNPADFLYDNLMIEANVIRAAHETGVEKLLFLGSSCIYPRETTQPVTEDALLSGPLESTNEAYAVAKISGIKLCQSYRRQHGRDFISVMPCNLYGPGDTYDLNRSHVIPALMMKMHAARDVVEVGGTGTPLREFLHVDDLAEALVTLLQHYSSEDPVNAGSGEEISIAALAREVAAVTGFSDEIRFNTAFPDGTPRKLLDSSRLRALGWVPRIALRDGLKQAYADYLERTARAAAA